MQLRISFTDQPNERSEMEEKRLSKRMDVDVKTIDRYLKRLKSEDYPLELAYDKKEVQLVLSSSIQ